MRLIKHGEIKQMNIKKSVIWLKYPRIKCDAIEKKIITIFTIMIFRILIDWYYLDYVSPIWGYMDMRTNINTEKVFISYLIVIISGLFIKWESEKFSGIAIQVLFLIMMIPLTSSYALSNQSTAFMVCCTFSFAISILLIQWRTKFRISKIIYRLSQYGSRYLLQTIIILILLYSIVIISSRGLNLAVLNIFNSKLIYGIREQGININGIWLYLYLWTYKIILPFFLGYFLNRKKYLLASIVLGIQLLIYLGDPHKEILFGMILILGLFFWGKKVHYGKLLLGTFICAIGGGMIFYTLFDSKIAFYELNILYRVFHIPASIKFQHFRFFSKRSKLFFSEGRIGQLLGIPYPYGNMSVGEVIAYYVLNDGTTNSNTGYIAYAYDDLGYFGVLLAGILLAIIFRLFDEYVTEKNQKWVTAVAIYPIIGLNDSGLLQWLLSGGAVVFLILLWVAGELSKDKHKRNNDKNMTKRINASGYFSRAGTENMDVFTFAQNNEYNYCFSKKGRL